MPRKPKAVKITRKPVATKATLLATIKNQEGLLTQARQLMEAMQTEIKQLTTMLRTQLQIIDNLSTKMRDD
jgi:hypothetical protein